jgi:hypothetical protein
MAETSGSYLVTQGYAVVNDAYADTVGQSASINDLNSTDIVSMGKNLSDFNLIDKFYGCLTNRIAKTMNYVLRYTADARNILMDSITWGAFIQKVYIDGPDAVETPAYKVIPDASTRLTQDDPTPYGVNQTLSATVKIFGGSTTWSLEFKTSEILLRKAFLNESEMIAFIDAQFTWAKTKMELEKESLVNLAINTGVCNAIKGGCVRNLLAEYNALATTQSHLTRDEALQSPDFLKWANKEINKTVKLMAKPSKKYNPEKYLNASSRDALNLEVLSDFADASKVFLESGTYHSDKVELVGQYAEISFFQYNGESFEELSSIDILNADIWKSGNNAVEMKTDGIIAIARDKDAVACTFNNNYSWSMPNVRARTSYYGYDFERGYAVDGHANFVVFTMNEVDIAKGSNIANVEIVGNVAIGNEFEIVVTPESGKSVTSVTVDGETVTAKSGKYKTTLSTIGAVVEINVQ